jgi:hypothetical protein
MITVAVEQTMKNMITTNKAILHCLPDLLFENKLNSEPPTFSVTFILFDEV